MFPRFIVGGILDFEAGANLLQGNALHVDVRELVVGDGEGARAEEVEGLAKGTIPHREPAGPSQLPVEE